jgi:hypothetical protein
MLNVRPSDCEIYNHGNVTLLARDLCEQYGWIVAENTSDGITGKGSFTLEKVTDHSKTFMFYYHLPEAEILLRDRLIAVMKGK